MALMYKTRGMVSPQGKARVFFCCHPEDFAPFFESVSEEILSYQNCAIWYKDGDVEYDDNFFSDLKQMQLFVMPVTSRLLRTDNTALSVEFKFAIDNHIPVLPLMQESGLEALFNEKCGDLQFLDKYKHDNTAIPYAEKLEKYLNSVIIGDELAEKIRKAFDAYVFLSYRKKDRKYARELMSLIHRNDFCRDIAIWYDEFLTPGEDFNKSIKEALDKSGLFVLAVTPSLIETVTDDKGNTTDNYIVRHEYPMARESGKPILPAELVPTDKGALSVKYPQLPGCADAYDSKSLRNHLLDAIRRMAITENDKDPEHNFFIGLAYLGGIDVEVDHERALTLITSSAEAELPEAMEKLVSMYRTGEGVQRDYNKAIEWQEKLVFFRGKKYIEDGNEDNTKAYFSSLWHLGDYQYELRKLDEANITYGKMLLVAEKASTKYDFKRNLSICYENLGDIAVAKGDLKLAEAYFGKGLAVREAVARETNTILAHRDLAVSYSKLGNIAKANGNLSLAEEYFKKGLDIDEAIVRDINTPQSRRDLSISYDKLGNIAKDRGDLSLAESYYQKSLAIRETLAAETNTVEARRGLSISYEKLGAIAKAKGDLHLAESYFQKELELDEAIAGEAGTVETLRGLSVCYNKLGEIARDNGDLNLAEMYFGKGLAIAEALARETNTLQARRDLSISYNRLGDIAKDKGDIKLAENYFKKGLDIFEAIAGETNTIESRRDLSVSYSKLGEIAKSNGNSGLAESCFKKGLDISEAIARETNTAEALRDLSVSCIKFGTAAQSNGDLSLAEVYFKKGLDIFESIARDTNTLQARRDLSVGYNKLGEILQAKGDLTLAEEYFKKGLAVFEAIAGETNSIESYDDLALSYYKLGSLKNERQYYEAAYQIWDALAAQFPNVASFAQRRDILRKMLFGN